MTRDSKKIHLLDIIRPIWKKRKFFILSGIVSGVLSVILVLLTEKNYTVEVVFIPQVNTEEGLDLGKNLGGIAALAGIEFGGGQSTNYPPLLYPKVMDKVNFQLELLSAELYFKEINDSISYRTYYEEYHKSDIWGIIGGYTIGLPGKLISAIKGEPELKPKSDVDSFYAELSLDDHSLVEQLKEQVKIIPNLNDGYVTVKVTMPDKYLAAQLTAHIQQKLHDELVSFKTNKINQEMEFIENRLGVKKVEFEESIQALAKFKDSNKQLITESSRVIQEGLQRKYDMAYSVYNQLAQQFEQVRLKAANDKPLITIIKPISIPNEKSSPNSILMVITLTILGLIITGLIVFYTDIKEYFLETIIENK